MTLQASGPISFQQINIELKLSSEGQGIDSETLIENEVIL